MSHQLLLHLLIGCDENSDVFRIASSDKFAVCGSLVVADFRQVRSGRWGQNSAYAACSLRLTALSRGLTTMRLRCSLACSCYQAKVEPLRNCPNSRPVGYAPQSCRLICGRRRVTRSGTATWPADELISGISERDRSDRDRFPVWVVLKNEAGFCFGFSRNVIDDNLSRF